MYCFLYSVLKVEIQNSNDQIRTAGTMYNGVVADNIYNKMPIDFGSSGETS